MNKIITALSDNKYLNWQLVLQVSNFEKKASNYEIEYIISYADKVSDFLKRFSAEVEIFNPNIKFFFYKDERDKTFYPPSVRHHILQKHITSNETFLLVDPDVLLTRQLDIENLFKDDTTYLSDTSSYLNSSYIKSKGEKLFRELASIAQLSIDEIEKNDKNAGGAQYLLKDVNSDFFKKTEELSNCLYSHMKLTEKIYSPQHPIQSWCADMWAILWQLIKDGRQFEIADSMKFGWPTDKYQTIKERVFFHNAGVSTQEDLFNKTHFDKTHPFNNVLTYINPNMGSYFFKEEVEKIPFKYLTIVNKYF